MNRKRAEPSWQTYGEVAGPKLELQKKKKKKIPGKNNEIIQSGKNLKQCTKCY